MFVLLQKIHIALLWDKLQQLMEQEETLLDSSFTYTTSLLLHLPVSTREKSSTYTVVTVVALLIKQRLWGEVNTWLDTEGGADAHESTLLPFLGGSQSATIAQWKAHWTRASAHAGWRTCSSMSLGRSSCSSMVRMALFISSLDSFSLQSKTDALFLADWVLFKSHH